MNIEEGNPEIVQRLAGYAARVVARSVGNAEASERAVSLLGSVVRKEAYVLAYIDGFLVIGWFIIGGLVLIALLRPAPSP